MISHFCDLKQHSQNNNLWTKHSTCWILMFLSEFSWEICKMCDHKSNDVNNMKRHINTVHSSTKKNFKCEHCNFETDQKLEYYGHVHNIHGLSLSGHGSEDMKIIVFNPQEGD